MNDLNSSGPSEGLIAKILREQSSLSTTEGGRRFTDLELVYIGQAVMGAAVDTTLATFESLMYCFAAFPDVLQQAQEEGDRLGGGKPPTAQMLGEMKYLKACISEVRITSWFDGFYQLTVLASKVPNNIICSPAYARERRPVRRLRVLQGNHIYCQRLGPFIVMRITMSDRMPSTPTGSSGTHMGSMLMTLARPRIT